MTCALRRAAPRCGRWLLGLVLMIACLALVDRSAEHCYAQQRYDQLTLTNITTEPFHFQALRGNGTWTDTQTLGAGEAVTLKRNNTGLGRSLLGFDAPSIFAVIRYNAHGGSLRWRLAGGQLPDVDEPQFFYMFDSNGIGRVEEHISVEKARERQTTLLGQPELTEEELAILRNTLRANWALYDK